MPLDVREINGVGDTGDCVQTHHQIMQRLAIADTPQMAFEVIVLDRVEADKRGEQAPVRFGEDFTA